MTALHIDRITLDTFKATLARYSDVAPSALAELDALRYETAPVSLASMKGQKALLKPDVEKLVEWKLKHGTFRPALMNLVKSNPADLIKSTTISAFSSLDTDNDILKALKLLTALRGIGPATASLLLSVYRPAIVPFFSDELFRWSHWDGIGPVATGPKAGQGWERKITYSVKEYGGILERVAKLRKRLGVGATDVEKVAYVLGREGARVDGGVGGTKEKEGDLHEGEGRDENEQKGKDEVEERTEGILKAIRDSEAEVKTKRPAHKDGARVEGSLSGEDSQNKAKKRKAQEQKVPIEGTRRSTRRKA